MNIVPTQQLIRIEQLGVKNFRSVRDIELELAPLTILIGPNNSGKSSILRALQAVLLAEDEPLLFIHPKFDLGSYRDVVHKHDTSRPIVIRFRVAALGTVSTQLDIEYRVYSQDGERCQVEYLRLSDAKLGHEVELDLRSRELRVRTGLIGGPGGVILKLPEEFCEELSRKYSLLKLITSIPVIALAATTLASTDIARQACTIVPYQMSFYVDVYNVLLSLARDLNVSALIACSQRAVHRRFLRPDESSSTLLIESLCNEQVREVVSTWLRQVAGVADLRVREVEHSLYQIVVRAGDLDLNIADLGHGLAYLVPALTACAVCRNVVVLEEPELHLHPCAQAELMNILVDLVRSGKQVVVETHSEHMIARLCRLVAEGVIARDLVKIYYVYKNEEGETCVKEIRIDAAGKLLEMPDFYEHDVQELLLTLRARGEVKLEDLEELYNIYKARYTAGEYYLGGLVELLEVLVKVGRCIGRATFQDVKEFLLSRAPELREVLDQLERLVRAYKFRKARVEVDERTISETVDKLRDLLEKLAKL